MINWGHILTFTFYLQNARFSKWRDPDSNRAHHDFQLGLVGSWTFLDVTQTAYIREILRCPVSRRSSMFVRVVVSIVVNSMIS